MITGVSPDLPHTHELPPAKEWGLRLLRTPVRLALGSWWRVRVHGREDLEGVDSTTYWDGIWPSVADWRLAG